MFLYQFLILISYNLICQILCQNSNITEIKLSQSYEGSNIDNGDSYFKLIIDSNQDNQDLVIVVTPTDKYKEFSDPDIYISNVNLY